MSTITSEVIESPSLSQTEHRHLDDKELQVMQRVLKRILAEACE